MLQDWSKNTSNEKERFDIRWSWPCWEVYDVNTGWVALFTRSKTTAKKFKKLYNETPNAAKKFSSINTHQGFIGE